MSEATALRRRDQVPRDDVTTIDGGTFSYRSIWQQKNLVLVALSETSGAADYVAALAACAERFRGLNAACVITRDPVPGLPAPGVVVADRWGEIVHVVNAASVAELPEAADLVDWLEFIGRRCAG